jgi:Family of unknown function (DUF6279)
VHAQQKNRRNGTFSGFQQPNRVFAYFNGRPMNVFRLILGTILLGLLTACGVAGLAYNNAPTVVSYYVDDWFDLTPEQSAWLKPRVTKLVDWHRQNELPTYRNLLVDMQSRVAQNQNTLNDVSKLYSASRQAVDRVTLEAMPDMVAFLQQIEPPQIAFIEKKFAADNRKLANDMKQPEEARRAKRVERFTERFEGWMGKLSEAQIALIKERIAPLPFSEELRLDDRKRWQREFISLLRSKADIFTIERELRTLMLTPEVRRAPAYQAMWQAQQDVVMKLTLELVNMATTKQRQAIQKKLSGYAEDVGGLLKA